MSFYIAKGLQLGGLCGLALALFFGITESMAREIYVGALSVAVFYAGRGLEARGGGA